METKRSDEAEVQSRQTDLFMIELLHSYAVLMEYQLMDLQLAVRKFVETMNDALMKLDGMVTEEGKHAQNLFESVFAQAQNEASVLNSRAANRVDDIITELLSQDSSVEVNEDLLNSLGSDTMEEGSQDAKDAVWSKMSKKLESVARLEERLRPHVYNLIQCLNFEDIQTQRLDHLLSGYKILNKALMAYLKEGEGVLPSGHVKTFANEFLKKVRGMYTMEEERVVFDEVFIKKAYKKHHQ
jgi:hypothetical protein